jgi:hypothetical protein
MVIRRIYQVVVILQIFYKTTAWYQASMPAKERNHIVQQLASVQKRAAVLISRALRMPVAEAVNMELYLTLIKY